LKFKGLGWSDPGGPEGIFSAELGAVISTMSKIPTPAEYLAVYKEKVAPKSEQIYQYLQFDEMEGYKQSA
jgi:aconitate hydratase 2/2-methylisocitrate dehydratase